MSKQKKDFWNMSWNPCWGCLYNCPYCYARRIAKSYIGEQVAKKEMDYRYGENWKFYTELNQIKMGLSELISDLKTFKPTWLESNYVREFPRKPSIIFVNSMSDPAYWKPEWYEKILKRICKNMQHTFVILTKQPEIYKKYTFPHNTIKGVTIVNQKQLQKLEILLKRYKKNNWYGLDPELISFEPIQEKIIISSFIKQKIFWIHVGEESGNRKGRVRSTREMIQPFFDLKDIPVFMKDNLNRLFPGQLRKEFPKL